MTPAFDHEVRFALVLYGGASLAIYIHGVTQEFFHLVRSTAVDAQGRLILSDVELKGTERVYRKLASSPDGTVRTRFLVDIASGTSAGGINAIFLGKALANGQTLDQVSKLWLDQADAQNLWNGDKFPRSLLSGQKMYSLLLDAFSGMEQDGTERDSLQAEMDVFITATDLQGLELPIQLADKTVFEKRHRNVFHLRFGDRENHFTREKNSFLAFAARATSAFPFAFEPACLQDQGASKPFFIDYGDGYTSRCFGDGGYLDNKPFTHAIQALSQRSSELPVARKLVYIEPSPEAPEASDNSSPGAPPTFLRNTVDALITLPREETIREDLQRVIERNRLIERVREITSHVEEDVKEFIGRVRGAEYQRRTLADEVRDRGPGYAGYHRLKVRAVTDELAALLEQPASDVDAWRRAHYSEQDPEHSESTFLLEYDLGYRERRIRFLLRKLCDPEVRQKLNGIAATLKTLRRADGTAVAIADRFREAFVRAAADVEACLDTDSHRYLDQFEYYDQIVFPIFYEASLGEAEVCEMFRISPCDATSIVDENAPVERGVKRRKLAGTALFHFGAFLNREWRENDLMWGRLDAAERIIRSILPADSADAAELIHKANLAIAGSEERLKHLQEIYEVDRKLSMFTRLKLGIRASRIVVQMLAGYFARNRQ